MKRFFYAIWEHIEYFFILALFVGVFYLSFTNNSYADPDYYSPPEYADKLFDESRVHRIDVQIDEKDLASLRENPREKKKYRATVTIDGYTMDNVSLSTRGNGSLGVVAELDDSNRYSYTLNFHKFKENGSYFGLDKLSLNSMVSDSSYLKNYLAYHIMAATGLEYPLASYTELYVNGELNGLYLATEGIDDSFLKRTNSSEDASLFHPVPYYVDYDRQYRNNQSSPDGAIISEENKGGSDLVYHGDAVENYDSIFENAVTKYSRLDEVFIIEAIESLSEFSLKAPEEYWNIDSVIRFFIATSLMPNSDSYSGDTAQNYYLKLSDGKLSLIPWDYDRAFHLEKESYDSIYFTNRNNAVSWPIDSPLIGSSEDERPLWHLVVDNPDYLERYHTILQTVLDEYIFNGDYLQDIESASSLIRNYVYSDPTKLTTNEGFEEEVEYLHHFIPARADAIQRQLWGIDPSTKNDSKKDNRQKEEEEEY